MAKRQNHLLTLKPNVIPTFSGGQGEKSKSYLIGIELLHSSLVSPPAISPDLTDLTYHIKFDYQIDKDKKLVFIIVNIRIDTFPAEAEVGKLIVSHIYEIADFDHVIDIKEGDKFSLPQELTTILNDISLSTTRGVMYTNYKGTFLHHALLPVVKQKALGKT